MTRVYLGLGSNLGDRQRLLHEALNLIAERIGNMVSLSSLYETAPWGFTSPHPFLNAAVAVDTMLEPTALLHATQEIERRLGRTQKSAQGIYHDRPIDIDLLLYGEEVIRTAELTVPHPGMAARRFVMEPLAEIAPDVLHPLSGKTMQELFQALLE